MKRTFKQFLKLNSLLVGLSLLSGCTDLGFPTIEAYYATFNDDVKVVYTNAFGKGSSDETKSFKDDFYNDDTVNDYEKGSSLTEQYYEYIVVEIEQDIEIEEFALSLRADKDVAVTVNAFLCLEDPTDEVKAFGDPTEDEDGEKIEYSDAVLVSPCTTLETLCKKDEWNSILTDEWYVDGKKQNSLSLITGQFFVIQIENNTGFGADKGLAPVKLIALNLMITLYNSEI